MYKRQVLRDRLPGDGEPPREALVELAELLDSTAAHEEGHLCDRTRYLPLSRNLLRVVAFLVESGFSPAGVARRLEYRAQLTALCAVADPRLPLSEILISAEQRAEAVTPHAAAYERLVRDLLELLAAELEADPGAWPAISPDHYLAHQLHWLGPEDVRRLALELARREGLVRGR